MIKILKTLMGSVTSLYLKIIEWRRKTKPPKDSKDMPGTKGAMPLLQAYFQYAVSRETRPRIAYTDLRDHVLSNEQ